MVVADGGHAGSTGAGAVPGVSGLPRDRRPVSDGWRVRVCDRAGHTRGAGVLIDADLVLTAANVLADRHQAAGDAVTVAFPASGARGVKVPASRVRPPAQRPDDRPADRPDHGPDGRSGGWAAYADRFALLRLSRPPAATPVRLARCGEPGNRAVSLYGYPRGMTDGVWARARACGDPAPTSGCIQLAADTVPAQRIGRGFRGAGVLDVRSGAVIGIVVAEDPASTAHRAWMLPVEAAAPAFPAVTGLIAAGPVLRRGWLLDLLDTLLAVPSVADQRTRDQIVSLLRPDIAATVRRHPAAHFDTWAILRICLTFPDGLPELVEVIRVFEGDSIPMLQLARAVAHLPTEAAF